MPGKGVLFVCMGNICRSPAAEGVFRKRLKERGIGDRLSVDSAGTLDYHAGEPPDARMTFAASRRGYNLAGRSRPIMKDDFERFDLIVAMDRENLQDIRAMDRRGRYTDKIVLFCDFVPHTASRDVPDPYYGGDEGFENVLDLIEEGCDGIIDHVLNGESG